MTQEEKAKAYDEAIEKLKEIITMDNNPVTPKELGEHLFPELAESEDEKIRKVLVGWVNIEPLSSFEGGFTKEDILAWLEKQGGQKSIEPTDLRTWKYIVDAVLTEENGIGNYLDRPETEKLAKKLQERFGTIKQKSVEEVNGEDYGIDSLWHAVRILEDTLGKVEGYQSDDGILEHKAAITAVKKLKEQKPVECNTIDRDKELSLSLQIQAYLNTVSDELYAKGKPLYSEKRIEDIHNCMKMWVKLHNAYFYCNLEHKPVEWSDEDKNKLEKLIGWLQGDYGVLQGGTQIFANWLKSLKDKVLLQAKQEWSEEDEDKIMLIEDSFSDYLDYIREDNSLTKHQKNTTKDNVVGYVNWLKSLHPQKHWKPSEEQIKMLETILYTNMSRNDERYPVLSELVEELKKLRY